MDDRSIGPGSAAESADDDVPAPALSTREAAARLGIDERSVRRAIARGDLIAERRGAGYRIAPAAVAAYAGRFGRATVAGPRPIVAPPAATAAEIAVAASSFVGRRDERARLVGLLRNPSERLLTLTGPGGVGKTRLALAAAAAARDAFPDGVAFVDLAPARRPEEVLPAVAETLGLRQAGEPLGRERLRAFLRTKRLLVILDNFEQVVAAAPAVAGLLAAAPDVTVLVTSRAPLRLAGERVVPVPPLGLPPAGEPATPEDVLASDAGRLFVERAEAGGGFALTAGNAPAVAEICRRLDGQPLALELAAARVRLLPPGALLARLEPRLPLLGEGRRDAPARQRTVRDAIAWSYDLLLPVEQRAFRWLAVCIGGFGLETAAALLGEARRRDSAGCPPPASEPGAVDILDRLGALLDQSLVQREEGPDGSPRFRILETIREFGLERLSAAGEEPAARTAHARAFLAVADGERRRIAPRAARAPLDRIEAEWPNLRTALTWLASEGPAASFVHLVAALPSFWWARSYHQEGRRWLERAGAVPDRAAPLDRGWVRVGLAGMIASMGDRAGAERLCAAGLPLVRAAGDPLETATALLWCGAMANYGDDHDRAEALLDESLALAEAIAEPDLAAATRGNALANLAVTARGRGDLDLAAGLLEAALRCFRDAGSDLGEARLLADLGELAAMAGDPGLAVARYRACLERSDEHGNARLAADALLGIASGAAGWGHWPLAGRLFGAAEAVRERAGLAPMTSAERARHGEAIAAVRRALGGAAAAEAWATGRRLGLEDAIAAARQAGPSAAEAAPVRLTRREREVLCLLAERRTDREIAAELFLSPRTVGWHVTSILSKLGVASRGAAAERARRDGLA